MLDRQVILVTGGNSRLGRIIVSYFAQKGHEVYATSRKPLTSEHKNVHFMQVDITSDSDVEKCLKQISLKEEKIDVIINNAGVTLTGPACNYTSDDFQKLLDINLVGPFRVIRTATKLEHKPKLVLNITSLNGFLALPDFGMYCASKFAFEGLSLSLHYELAPQTRVITVAPGALKAESDKKMPHKPAREKFPILNWLLPLTTLEDVAEALEKLMMSNANPPRVLVGRDAKIIALLQRVLPFSLFDKLIFYISQRKT